MYNEGKELCLKNPNYYYYNEIRRKGTNRVNNYFYRRTLVPETVF